MGNKVDATLRRKYYKPEEHAYCIYEQKIADSLKSDHTVLDAGCGATAPILSKFVGKTKRLIGIDLVDFKNYTKSDTMQLIKGNLENIELNDSSIDVVISRSVLEHVYNIDNVYSEIGRVLKKGGKFIFLVPNLWDYNSLISCLIPNQFHSFFVQKLTGRKNEDTFPTFYKSNTNKSIRKLANKNNFEVKYINYIGQYPYMLEFNKLLFVIGTAYDKLVSRFEFTKYLRGWILVELVKR